MDGSIQGNEQEICPAARQAIERFRQHRPELEEKHRSGALRYVVEWWEEDSLDIDENAHIFFQFEGDGEYIWDFLTPRQLHDEMNDLLAIAGITWEYGFELHFGSNILYPPDLAGQPYYEISPQPPKKWWERMFDYLTGNDGEQWVRRKDLPLP